MPQINEQNRDRIRSALVVAAFHALLGYALLTGLGFDVPAQVGERLKLFDAVEEPLPPLAEPPPPKPTNAKRPKPKAPEGAASPANLKNTPSEIVAPPPEIRLEVPPSVIVAPIAGQGAAPAAGAAQVPGPGTGSGGVGTGLGSGTQGTGTGGGGGGGGLATRARWLRGRISEADYPSAAFNRRIGGTVFLRFVVAPTGRVSECAVTRSSGSRELDGTTCRLILQRFRYRPARNAYGEPVAEVIRGEHVWEIGPEPPPIDIEPDIPDPQA
jgi:protein TonB